MNAFATSPAEVPDPELLDRCLCGDRDAFGQLISKYQGLICAQAYAVCGDLSKSEDVAQEAFISAWSQLGELREPSKFKPWLCGIARHLALRVVEKRQRDQGSSARLREEPTSWDTPHDVMVSREEEAIVWETLEQLPESYRIPLILFYREQQSTFEVARALDLSEDAVKQRLSRGRAILKQQVASVVENALSRSRPGAAFVTAVLASLGATGPAAASAAITAVAGTKSGSPLALSSISIPLLSGALGTGIGVLGAWLAVRISAESAPYERERQELLRSGRRVAVGVALYVLLEMVSVAAAHYIWKSASAVVLAVVGLTTLYLVWLFSDLAAIRRRIQKIRRDEEAAGACIRKQPTTGIGRYFVPGERTEYRSRTEILGLPLLHLIWDNHAQPDPGRNAALGWIAIGTRATGVVAFGGIARGLFAFGGLAIGVFAFGGLGIGIFTLGGCALGAWCYGGVAIGGIVHAGLGVAWELSVSAFAVSKEYGLGHFVVAPHANDAAALAAVKHSSWIQLTTHPWFPIAVPSFLVVAFALQGWITSRVQRETNAR